MIKKFYLTRTHTRAMALDHPIGDPTGGAAYGEKNDPISAIIAIGSMGATYAAAGSFAAMTIFQGITFAGAALSLVGNVTGNKTLSKIGMIAGLAGGLGMAYDSVMGTATGGTLGEAFDSADRAFNGSKVSLAEVTTAPGSQSPVVNGRAVVPDASVVDVNAVTDPSAASRSLSTTSNINTAPNLSPAVDPLNPGTNILGQSNPQMSYAPGAKTPISYGDVKPTFAQSMKAGNFADAAGAVGSGAMDMLKNNPTGAYVAAQAIGAAADFLSGKTDAELDALKANTGYANAKALEVQAALDREKLRRANLNSGYTNVNAGFKVNPNAAVAQPFQQPGLVAGAMQPRQG